MHADIDRALLYVAFLLRFHTAHYSTDAAVTDNHHYTPQLCVWLLGQQERGITRPIPEQATR